MTRLAKDAVLFINLFFDLPPPWVLNLFGGLSTVAPTCSVCMNISFLSTLKTFNLRRKQSICCLFVRIASLFTSKLKFMLVGQGTYSSLQFVVLSGSDVFQNVLRRCFFLRLCPTVNNTLTISSKAHLLTCCISFVYEDKNKRTFWSFEVEAIRLARPKPPGSG